MSHDKIIRPIMQKTIGLLGGCSNVATGEYYKLLNAQVNDRLGGWDIAETLIVGMNFGNIEALVRQGDEEALTRYLNGKIARLAAGGADIMLCVSNTLHHYIGPIAQAHNLPFIHIADPTGASIKQQNLTRIALFGTRPAMEMDHLRDRYRDRFGLDIIIPNAIERAEIDRIIFDELVKSDVRQSSREAYLRIAKRLMIEEGAQGLILGCTEIFLLLSQHDMPELPMFNTTQLHCQAAVDFALSA